MDTAINWGYLSQALSAYQELGYRYVELPWMIPKRYNMITCLHESWVMDVEGYGSLVGSAEQAFLYMNLTGQIPDGKYVGLTPCFRTDEVDASHSTHFMKVELYESGPHVTLTEAADMMSEAMLMMESLAGRQLVIEHTTQGADLMMNGVEVGSYGVREHEGHKWAYGTGLAEPRFSYAVNLTRR